MENINLNPGGLIGTLVGGGITAALIFRMFEVDPNRSPIKICVAAMCVSGVIGNFFWSLVAQSPRETVNKRPKRKITTPVDSESPQRSTRARVRKKTWRRRAGVLRFVKAVDWPTTPLHSFATHFFTPS